MKNVILISIISIVTVQPEPHAFEPEVNDEPSEE